MTAFARCSLNQSRKNWPSNCACDQADKEGDHVILCSSFKLFEHQTLRSLRVHCICSWSWLNFHPVLHPAFKYIKKGNMIKSPDMSLPQDEKSRPSLTITNTWTECYQTIPKAQWPVTKQQRMASNVITSSLENHVLEEKQTETERERK
jgi:hypothetical protein